MPQTVYLPYWHWLNWHWPDRHRTGKHMAEGGRAADATPIPHREGAVAKHSRPRQFPPALVLIPLSAVLVFGLFWLLTSWLVAGCIAVGFLLLALMVRSLRRASRRFTRILTEELDEPVTGRWPQAAPLSSTEHS